jgi:two-component system sensor histidine kinase/response regulator
MMNKKILIVDNDIDNLKVIIEHIEADQQPYVLLQALSGSDAFDIAVVEIPDLIITDWEMPIMDGIELIERIKDDNRTSDIPVIMCTGAMLTSEHLKKALQAGAVDYIQKPIDKIELLARIQASLRLSDSYKEIKELNKSKDEIFSIIAHDLRGPVGNIESFAKIILSKLSEPSETDIVEMIKIIARQSTSAFNILDNLFSWAKSQQNQLNFKPENHSISSIVDDNIELLSGNAIQKDISLQNDISESVEAFVDATLVSVIIRNLIANAIKYTSVNGKVILNAKEENSHILVSISDNGVGIESNRITTLFTSTSYQTTSGTNYEKGSGLGLKLCKSFVEKSNGKIWAESKVGEGSTFYFTIPGPSTLAEG